MTTIYVKLCCSNCIQMKKRMTTEKQTTKTADAFVVIVMNLSSVKHWTSLLKAMGLKEGV
jgi:hypothetical protein